MFRHWAIVALAACSRYTVDLDRDGVPDVLVPRPCGCPEEIEWDVYVSRAGCGHHVGRVAGSPHGRTEELAAGLLDLHTSVDVANELPSASTRHRFDGVAYRVLERREHTARCMVHPADCWDDGDPRSCAVRLLR